MNTNRQSNSVTPQEKPADNLAGKDRLPVGKLTPAQLQKIVFPNLGKVREDVLVHSSLGEDSTVIDFGDWVAVLSTDPITGAAKNQGWLGVHVCCNDIAAMGAAPLGVLVTILFAETSTADDARTLMEDVGLAASELGIEVLGGHSEVTPGIPSTIISVTAVGKVEKTLFVTTSGARPGDTLILTKSAGLEGTAILASDRSEYLRQRLAPEEIEGGLIERAASFIKEISVVPEGLIAARNGATAMHDVTEGGVLGAAFELASASGLGVEVWADSVPIRPETEAIARAFEVDPLRLVSSGALLIAAPDPERIIEALANAGIGAAAIGRLDNGEMLIVQGSERRPLDPPEGDELWAALSRGSGNGPGYANLPIDSS